ncbi:hypothetical protein KDH_66320 [Dictyobacter sp. S3.2.2.5]|uniref:Methyltransferase domain-containing protein n=1 Tax=Dictyobacter halimunensis TaxID=3026934 RepID=A0ABQ6FZX6_9CHLR|nr:hypothetical protein KDH_66320 [Dictyobacter sp. S3.2.2.5]
MSVFSFLTREKLTYRPSCPSVPSCPVSFMRGRRHRVDVPYALPKDEREEERLAFQHYTLHKILGGHYHAPIEPTVERILDVGTGTAKWAHDIARLFPQAQVYGLDLELPQGVGLPPPGNYHFVQGNVLQALPFPDNQFDFVHQRLLVSAIPSVRWPDVLHELVRVTKPGGYIELAEAGNSYQQVGASMQTFLNWGQIASIRKGIDVSLMPYLGDLLARVDMRHIRTRTFQLPVGTWGGKEGDLYARDMYAAFQGLKNFYCAVGDVDPDNFDAILADLPQEWEFCHTTHAFYIAYGQK